ncbi:MAG TPA: DUF2269 family protein [Dehalococcoidia bacterium]|nr:DUF2269 family protein [Dehalococcoidia bacterium]
MLSQVLLFLHLLAAFWLVAGIVAVSLPLLRAYSVDALEVQHLAVEEAHHYQGVLLLPGAILTGATGVFYWSERGYDLFTTGWLLALGLLYLVLLLVFLPLINLGLRRLRLAVLQAVKEGGPTPELAEALAERVPLAFAALAALWLVPLLALSLFAPS